MKRLFHTSVNLHCWGGYGSQLNAVAMAHRLNELFTYKKITLVIHEGGRHNAKYELDDFDLSDFNINFITDPNINNHTLKNNSKSNIRIILKYCLIKLGIYSTCNSLEDLQKLKPWVLTIRGSYNIFPTENFLNFLNSKLKKIVIEKQCDVVIHYRLGDLISIEEKDPIEVPVLIELLELIAKKQVINNVIVLTSDPEIASSLFKKNNAQIASKIQFFYATPSEVLSFGVSGKVFIGTNSKMSLWPIWLRSINNSANNYLPSSFQKDSIFLSQNTYKKFNITFY